MFNINLNGSFEILRVSSKMFESCFYGMHREYYLQTEHWEIEKQVKDYMVNIVAPCTRIGHIPRTSIIVVEDMDLDRYEIKYWFE